MFKKDIIDTNRSGFYGVIKVAFAEDDKNMKKILEKVLTSDQDIELVGIASNGIEIVDIVEKKRPDIVLMDINMPYQDGLESTKKIKERFPAVSVIILTVIDDISTILEALKAGANGYFLKSAASESILRNIKSAYDGGVLLPVEISQKIYNMFFRILEMLPSQNKAALDSFSNRELEVLKLVASGKNNREIAKTLCLSEGTVKNYISTLLKKFDVKDRVNLVLYAIRAGIKL